MTKSDRVRLVLTGPGGPGMVVRFLRLLENYNAETLAVKGPKSLILATHR